MIITFQAQIDSLRPLTVKELTVLKLLFTEFTEDIRRNSGEYNRSDMYVDGKVFNGDY